MRGDSAEVLFQFFSFLQQACVSSSGMGRDAHSLVLSIQHILCWPRCHSPSEVPFRMVLDMLSWQLTCSNHASFCFLTAREDWSHYLSLNQLNKVLTCLNNHMILCSVVFSSGCLFIWGKMVNVRLFLLFFFFFFLRLCKQDLWNVVSNSNLRWALYFRSIFWGKHFLYVGLFQERLCKRDLWGVA